MITFRDLKNYKYIDRAISMAQKRLEDIGEKPMLMDKVSGSSQEYPYGKRNYTVSGVDEAAIDAYNARYREAKGEYDRLVRMKSDIERLRQCLPNVRDRIMIEYVIDGRSQSYIARQLKMSQSSLSERVLVVCERFLSDNSDNSDKNDKTGV